MRFTAPSFWHGLPLGRIGIGVVCGLLVVLSGVEPTGNVVIDVVETVLAVVLVTVVGARAPWWMLVGAAGLAGAIGLSWSAVLVAVAALIFAAWVAPIDQDDASRADIGALSVGLSMVAFSLSDLDAATGVTALLGIGSGVALVIGGWRHVDAAARVPLGRALAAIGALFAIGALTTAIAANGARDDANAAERRAREGARLTAALDAEEAALRMSAAADDFAAVNDRMTRWWTAPGRLVPVVAQNRSAVAGLSGELSEQLEAASADLAQMSLEELRVVNGAVDLDAIRELEEPVTDLAQRFDLLAEAAADADSAWLVGDVRSGLDEFESEVLSLGPQIDDAVDAVDLVPDMLGGSAARRYLLLFTTPSEARGLGGFIGNYAIVSVDDGRMEFVESGRRVALEEAARDAEVTLSGPPALMSIFGKFGLGGDDAEPVGGRSWSNITTAPNWHWVAPAAVELYNDSGFDPIDGVLVVDPYVLGQLTRYSGAVETRDGERLRGDALVDYIILGQYETDRRLDALEVLSERIVEAFLDTRLPRPLRLARDFGPLIDEQRLLVWTDRPEEAELLDSVGIGRGLPVLGANDAFSLGITNAAGNKLDAFLETSLDVRHVETDDGWIVRATVELHNAAPTEGYPDYVIGNLIDQPDGYHKMVLHAFGTAPVDVRVDGVVVDTEREVEEGWFVSEHFVELEPDQRMTIEYDLSALYPDEAILVREQPMVRDG